MQYLLQDSTIYGSDASHTNYKSREAVSKAVIFKNKNNDEAIIGNNTVISCVGSAGIGLKVCAMTAQLKLLFFLIYVYKWFAFLCVCVSSTCLMPIEARRIC